MTALPLSDEEEENGIRKKKMKRRMKARKAPPVCLAAPDGGAKESTGGLGQLWVGLEIDSIMGWDRQCQRMKVYNLQKKYAQLNCYSSIPCRRC